MIKYNYRFKYIEEFNMVVMDFDEEKSLEFANMISDPLGSDIPWRLRDLKNDIDNFIDLLKGNIPEYRHGGNASSIISYRDFTIIEDPFYDEDEDEFEPICKLETVEFVKIILVWAYETYKYKSERGVIAQEDAEIAINWIEKKMEEVKSIEDSDQT
ncbi:hypothetical protein CN679_18975 [Bacillus pseudomycoides]|uniref:hypothetical protein n=1 Tax=Bacillus pseudomycoides TaxID=64104 RepID=UPI000BEFCF14|nr:hypothetical protein [Bacillus pseudomycoides]PEI90048.1 hypothetical protein CN679_18975 [Bacillus pseudomycoides]